MTQTLPACLQPKTKEERRLARLLEKGTPEERKAEYDALQARFDAMSQEEYDTEPVTRLVCFQGYLQPDVFQPEREVRPEVNMGATIHIGSDSYAATIIHVTPKTVVVQYDTATPDEGHDYYGSQKWKCTANPNGEKKTFYLNSSERWVNKCYHLTIGKRVHYSDPGF